MKIIDGSNTPFMNGDRQQNCHALASRIVNYFLKEGKRDAKRQKDLSDILQGLMDHMLKHYDPYVCGAVSSALVSYFSFFECEELYEMYEEFQKYKEGKTLIPIEISEEAMNDGFNKMIERAKHENT